MKKLKKNGEAANVPSSRPTQNYCATKQNWNEITKQKCVETNLYFIIIIILYNYYMKSKLFICKQINKLEMLLGLKRRDYASCNLDLWPFASELLKHNGHLP